MHYVKELTVPAGTASGSPARTDVTLAAGTLRSVKILFPPGCARLVFVVIYNGATQIYPKEPATSYAEDAKEIAINTFDIFDSAPTLTLRGWAPSTNYAHKITFTFELQTVEETAMQRSGYY